MMKNIIILLIGFLTFNNIYSQKLKLNTESSTVKWVGSSAVGSYKPQGTLEPSNGIIVVKNDSIMYIGIEINMKSLNSQYPRLTKHLKSVDFFDVKKYSKSRFQMSVPIKIENNKASLEGEFEIKEKRKKEKLNLNFKRQNNKVILSGNLILDRTAYGIIYNSKSFFDNLKDQAIADLFQLDLYLEFAID